MKKLLPIICLILIIPIIYNKDNIIEESILLNNFIEIECSNLLQLTTSLELFKDENYDYPDSNEGLNILVINPDVRKYLNHRKYIKKRSLFDSWGNHYVYKKFNDNFEILSYGSDGEIGGDGNAQDISNTNCIKNNSK